MKHLLIRIEQDWRNIKFNEDLKIMHKFYERGRVLTLAYAIVTMFSILGLYLASPTVPKFLDVIYPLNQSRDRIYLYQTEYFVDPDEYYIPILIHAYMTVPVSLCVLVFVDNMFAMYIHHACGLFAALRLHIESIHITIDTNINMEAESKRYNEIHQKITMCVNMHKNVIEFFNELESSGSMSYLIILMINLSMITVTAIVTVMKIDQPSESTRFLAFTIGVIFHIFFSCFMGQKLIDESSVIFHAVYGFEWYSIPTNLQSLVIPIMIRSKNPCRLTAGKIITLSMDTFSLTTMNIFESRYFQINKRVFIFLGQWPFQNITQRNFLRIFVMLAMGSILMPKLIKFIEILNDIDGVIECIPMVGLHMVSFFKYLNWIFNSRKMKNLLLHMQKDWDSLKCDRDIAIMHKFSERARIISVAYASAMFSILGLYLASPAVPRILDMILPLNESRHRIYLYQTEYFVDRDEYYIPILLHAYMTVPISLSVIVFVDNMFAMYIHHACGLFSALSVHLGTLHTNNVKKSNDNDLESSAVIHQKIIMCVKMHRNVIDFSNELESSCTIVYLIVLTFNLMMITVTGVVTVMKLNQPSEAIKFLAFTLGEIFHLFFTSYQGQQLIEQSELVFTSVYMSEWYTSPTNMQSLLILIMVRSKNPCKLTAGTVYTISMDTFSVVCTEKKI
ncbi:hypothetical protein PV327_000351 [Microctonus hyperodae]|uniref:Odorant receptor n=1 Tax=Microctonus hyperodae TaxID=165561 RepID=A0AA39G611_MICHY|nr:hypothetical protein PV327_000351 [Microctonus hyperodae]